MEVTGQPHASASLPPGTEPSIPIAPEVGWAPEQVWSFWESKDFLPCIAGNQTRSRPARRLISMFTELFQLPKIYVVR